MPLDGTSASAAEKAGASGTSKAPATADRTARMMTAHQGTRPKPMAMAAVATASPATAIRPSQNRMASRTASVIQFVRQAYCAQRRNQFVEMVAEHTADKFIGGTMRKAGRAREDRKRVL